MPTPEQKILGVIKIELEGDRQAQLRQIFEAINALDDEPWRQLPSIAQHWANTTADVLRSNADAKIKDFADTAPAKPEPVKEEKKVAKSTNKTLDHAPTPRAKHASNSKHEGAPVLIRRMIRKNPKITAKEVSEKLGRRDISPFVIGSTVSVAKAHYRELASLHSNPRENDRLVSKLLANFRKASQ